MHALHLPASGGKARKRILAINQQLLHRFVRQFRPIAEVAPSPFQVPRSPCPHLKNADRNILFQ